MAYFKLADSTGKFLGAFWQYLLQIALEGVGSVYYKL
jgi:hypothetical protein